MNDLPSVRSACLISFFIERCLLSATVCTTNMCCVFFFLKSVHVFGRRSILQQRSLPRRAFRFLRSFPVYLLITGIVRTSKLFSLLALMDVSCMEKQNLCFWNNVRNPVKDVQDVRRILERKKNVKLFWHGPSPFTLFEHSNCQVSWRKIHGFDWRHIFPHFARNPTSNLHVFFTRHCLSWNNIAFL